MNKNLLAVILIVVGIGIYFTITQDMIASAQAVKDKNDKLAKALDDSDKIVQFRNALKSKYNSISTENRAKIDKMIPSSVDNIRLVIDLQNNIAQSNNFALTDVKAYVGSNPSNATPGGAAKPAAPTAAMSPTAMGPLGSGPRLGDPTLDKVTVTFKAKASYQQFQNFMRDIEKDLRIMDLTKLSLRANDTGTYDFDVAYDTYWLRQ